MGITNFTNADVAGREDFTVRKAAAIGRWAFLAFSIGLSSVAFAEETADELEEVVVFAKRPVTMQESTTAVTVLDADKIDDFQILSSKDLQSRVPGLVALESFGRPKVYIRGLGTESTTVGAEPSIAIYMDGVYLGRQFAAYSSQLDLVRVEVLRGPQGTISGRNSTGGAISYYSKQPSTESFSGDVKATIGSLDTMRLEGSVNIPFSDKVAGRFAALVNRRENYATSIGSSVDFKDTEGEAFKATIAASLSENIDLTLRGDWAEEDFEAPPILRSVSPIYTGVFGFTEGVDYAIADDSDYDGTSDVDAYLPCCRARLVN